MYWIDGKYVRYSIYILIEFDPENLSTRIEYIKVLYKSL